MKSDKKQANDKKKRAAERGKPSYEKKPGRGEPKPIVATIFVQDPAYAKQAAKAREARQAAREGDEKSSGRARRGKTKRVAAGLKRITLNGEPWIGAGPRTSRVAVVDIEASEFDASKDIKDEVVRKRAVRVLRKGGGFATGSAEPENNRQFRQVNVWAVVSHVLDHIESGKVFGRRLQWAFPGRLRIYPHYELDDNAYYHRESGGLYFGYFYGYDDPDKRDPVYLCLCHDVVTHELGHAVLDGLKPRYAEEGNAEEAGFSEYFGDALAMTSALTMREVVKAVVGRDPGALDGKSLVSDIASQFGNVASTWSYDGIEECLRSAENSLKLGEVAAGFERYGHSLVLTGAFYDVLQAIYARELKVQEERTDNRKSGQRAVAALFNAADRTSRMMLRGLDYCPPAGLTYRAYAQGVIRADEVAWPVDSQGYRDIVAGVFVERGIVSSVDDLRPERTIANNQLWSYDVEVLSASKADAYDFLDRNRKVLEIPRDVEIEVARIYRTSKIAAGGYRPPREIVVEFEWSEPWTLDGEEFGALAGTVRKVWCGGTMIFGTNQNVLHYCLTTTDETRMARMKAYLVHSNESGAIEMVEDGKAMGMHGAGKMRARVVDGTLELTRSPGMCHASRGMGATSAGEKGQ